MHVSTCSSVLFYEQLPGIPTNVISPASSKLFCDLYPLKFFSDFYTLSGLKVYDTQPNLVATIILVWSGKLCALQTAGIREIGEIVRQTGKREVWIYVPLSDVYYIYIYIYIFIFIYAAWILELWCWLQMHLVYFWQYSVSVCKVSLVLNWPEFAYVNTRKRTPLKFLIHI